MDFDLGVGTHVGFGPEAKVEHKNGSGRHSASEVRAAALDTLTEIASLKYDYDGHGAVTCRPDSIAMIRSLFSEDGGFDIDVMSQVEIFKDNRGSVVVTLLPADSCSKRAVSVSSPCEPAYRVTYFDGSLNDRERHVRYARHVGGKCTCIEDMIEDINNWLSGKPLVHCS